MKNPPLALLLPFFPIELRRRCLALVESRDRFPVETRLPRDREGVESPASAGVARGRRRERGGREKKKEQPSSPFLLLIMVCWMKSAHIS